jgi:hypothetical protein
MPTFVHFVIKDIKMLIIRQLHNNFKTYSVEDKMPVAALQILTFYKNVM